MKLLLPEVEVNGWTIISRATVPVQLPGHHRLETTRLISDYEATVANLVIMKLILKILPIKIAPKLQDVPVQPIKN